VRRLWEFGRIDNGKFCAPNGVYLLLAWNGFFAPRFGIDPNGMRRAFHAENDNREFLNGAPGRGVSQDRKLDLLSVWIIRYSFSPVDLQQLAHSLDKTFETFFPCLTLTICSRDFQARRPIAPFVRFSAMENGSFRIRPTNISARASAVKSTSPSPHRTFPLEGGFCLPPPRCRSRWRGSRSGPARDRSPLRRLCGISRSRSCSRRVPAW
jgi:hypothetical protein